jgi:hypothetical protein
MIGMLLLGFGDKSRTFGRVKAAVNRSGVNTSGFGTKK